MTPIPLPNYPHVYQKLTTRWEKIILIILIYLKIFLSETAHDSFDGLDFFQLFPADLKSNIARKYSTLIFIFYQGFTDGPDSGQAVDFLSSLNHIFLMLNTLKSSLKLALFKVQGDTDHHDRPGTTGYGYKPAGSCEDFSSDRTENFFCFWCV